MINACKVKEFAVTILRGIFQNANEQVCAAHVNWNLDSGCWYQGVMTAVWRAISRKVNASINPQVVLNKYCIGDVFLLTFSGLEDICLPRSGHENLWNSITKEDKNEWYSDGYVPEIEKHVKTRGSMAEFKHVLCTGDAPRPLLEFITSDPTCLEETSPCPNYRLCLKEFSERVGIMHRAIYSAMFDIFSANTETIPPEDINDRVLDKLYAPNEDFSVWVWEALMAGSSFDESPMRKFETSSLVKSMHAVMLIIDMIFPRYKRKMLRNACCCPDDDEVPLLSNSDLYWIDESKDGIDAELYELSAYNLFIDIFVNCTEKVVLAIAKSFGDPPLDSVERVVSVVIRKTKCENYKSPWDRTPHLDFAGCIGVEFEDRYNSFFNECIHRVLKFTRKNDNTVKSSSSSSSSSVSSDSFIFSTCHKNHILDEGKHTESSESLVLLAEVYSSEQGIALNAGVPMGIYNSYNEEDGYVNMCAFNALFQTFLAMDCVIEASIQHLLETDIATIDYQRHSPKELVTGSGRTVKSPSSANSRQAKVFIKPVVPELPNSRVITEEFVTREFAKVFVLAKFLPRNIGNYATMLDLLNLYGCFEDYLFHTESLWRDFGNDNHLKPGEGLFHQPSVLFQQFCRGIPKLIGKFFRIRVTRGGTCCECKVPRLMEVEDAFCIVFPPLPSKKKEENKEETEEKEEKEKKVEEEGKEEKKKRKENLTFSYLLSELEKDVNQLACVNADSGCIGNVLSSLQFEFMGGYVVFHMPLQIDLSESVWLDPNFIAEDAGSEGKNVFQFAIDRINFRSLGKRDLEVFGIVDTSGFHVVSNIIHHTTAPSGGRNKDASSVKMTKRGWWLMTKLVVKLL